MGGAAGDPVLRSDVMKAGLCVPAARSTRGGAFAMTVMLWLAALGMTQAALAQTNLPQTTKTETSVGQATVQGLTAPVDIVTDTTGIPHITAQTIPDAFFGQGYAAAASRLWQMDLAHRRGLGHLAAAFGPAFIPFDVAARTMLFQGDLAAEWQALDPRVPPIVRAWVAGINARIREVRADPRLLPPEFVALGTMPEEWAPEDMLRARYAGAGNVSAELRRARLACAGALAADGLAQQLEPDWPLAMPAGLDPCAIVPGALALKERLTAPLPFNLAEGALSTIPDTSFAAPADIDSAEGSNAWVIAPGHSATGRAILANDPHLPFSVPSPRMITHITAPGLDAIGSGPAYRPGFQFGHTDRIAFGRTDFRIDQEDLFVLDLNEDSSAYRTPAGWQPITRSIETIQVRGHTPVIVTIGTTPVGPIISEQKSHAVVLRAASMLPGPPVGLEYVLIPLATDWQSYRAAIRAAVWGSNYMYADIDGNIGWQAGGRSPRRLSYDGLMPVPASGGYDWDGLIPIEELPSEYNPARGWIATANQMPFPADYPINLRRVGFEWVPDDRYRRIAAVLQAQPIQSLADSVALQHDTYSLRAEALLPLLDRIHDPALAGDVAMLRAWDGRVDAGSDAAALYEFWSASLQALLLKTIVPPAARGIITSIHPHVARDLLLAPDARLGPNPVAVRDALLDQALSEAAAARAGRNWGAIHTVNLRHVLSKRLPRLHGDVTGLGSGGDGATVMARWWAGLAKTNTSGGAMFAAVVDVGNWDATLSISAPGQSGDPRSVHYSDTYRPWLMGEYRPLPFSAAAVAAAAETHIRLIPGGD